jgi:NTE family protein
MDDEVQARTAKRDATRVALVLDAGGARSAYQVGALEVLLPALAERGTRPRMLLGTSAGALLTGALGATAHLEPDDQIARLKTMLAGPPSRT